MLPNYSWSLLLICIQFPSRLIQATQIYPSSRLVVQEGQGFLVKLATDSGFGPVKYCTFLFNSQPYFLHPGNENEVAYVTELGETVQRFTVSECGVKVSNVSLKSSGIWQLGATSGAGVDASADFQLQVIPAVQSGIESSTTVSGRPGTSVVINCSPESVDEVGDHQHCEMWEEDSNNGREGLISSCKWTTSHPQLMERKQILCRTFARGSMEAVIKRWTVVGEYLDTTSDYLNGDSSVVLRCKRKDTAVTGCYMRNQQTGEMYRITNGLNGRRYSSFRSHLARGLCQFEIPKPIRGDELGSWSMRVFYRSGQDERFDECLFSVTDGNVFQV